MSDHVDQFPDSRPPPQPGGLPAWAIGPAFLALAAWLVLASPRADVPVGDIVIVSRDRFGTEARRQPTVEAFVVVGGFEHRCNDCHRFFTAPPVEDRRLVQHTGIVLNHGMNNRCFNCHDRTNRERLVLHDGSLIGFNEVPRLCAQCHGTVFRDWQSGMHGKTLGAWDAASGLQHRLGCNDCHDPHSPAYPPMAALPGPNTLRMGDQTADGAHAERHRPLRRWSLPGGPGHTGDGAGPPREEGP